MADFVKAYRTGSSLGSGDITTKATQSLNGRHKEVLEDVDIKLLACGMLNARN